MSDDAEADLRDDGGLDRLARYAEVVPPQVFFVVSAIFHYLGPSFAVLLFAHVEPLGVASLRIATAGLIFALWRRPWRFFVGLPRADQFTIVALGLVLAAMNALFYLAIARLPLGTVGAIEFLGPIGLAAIGLRNVRNVVAMVLAVGGVYLLTDVRIEGEPLGFVFAFANCALFTVYIILGHRIAKTGGADGIDRLGVAMLIAMVASLPLGIADAVPALVSPIVLLAAVGVGISSSVIPYVADQLAMARLPRASFALMLSLLPATATAIGFIVLGQAPALVELTGVALVIFAVGLHQARRA